MSKDDKRRLREKTRRSATNSSPSSPQSKQRQATPLKVTENVPTRTTPRHASPKPKRHRSLACSLHHRKFHLAAPLLFRRCGNNHSTLMRTTKKLDCGLTTRLLMQSGALKMQDMKMQDMKLADQYARHEIAGHEITRHANAKQKTSSEAANVWV